MTDYYHNMTEMSAANGFNKPNDKDRKLFIGGLSWDTEEKDLRDYFSKYGQVVDASIKYDAVSGNPRGFGFITFAFEGSIDEVLRVTSHVIRNKPVDPKRVNTRPICKKIFVGGIDSNMGEEDIKLYFSQFGNVKGIELPFDRQRNRRREFCFILFDTEEAVDAAVKDPKQTIGNKECDIKKAKPQPVSQHKRMQHQSPGYNGYESNGGNRRAGGSGSSYRRNQNDYQSTSGWNGYSGAVSQTYYSNYYGNHYPNA
ncbi:RNA-binding protein squid-like [Oppia nitens]|uniref:RNA-binding protein squid-like n=1 Tax=Oppia nitens TaxID=1686743 RepID=UPI0023DC54EB|nr:RNA-binding protein squid-like [Oppia nitens]